MHPLGFYMLPRSTALSTRVDAFSRVKKARPGKTQIKTRIVISQNYSSYPGKFLDSGKTSEISSQLSAHLQNLYLLVDRPPIY